MRTPFGETFRIEARGQTWSGTWSREGKEVCVSSAFGSARASVGRRKAEDVAREILGDLVASWCAKD